MAVKRVIEQFLAQARRRQFAPEQIIIHAGDVPSAVYYVERGSVSVLLEDENGREMVVAYLNAGDFFGEMGLFPEQRLRTAQVRARVATTVAEMSYAAFREFALQRGDVMFELAGQMAARLRDTTQKLADLTFLDVSGRLTQCLLRLSQQPDARAHARGQVLRTSRQELARMVGCSREMVGRALKKLEEDGLIESLGRSIVVRPRPQSAD
jgi:CRP/FNR family cyclic AMP-dependent transcriptional regulator